MYLTCKSHDGIPLQQYRVRTRLGTRHVQSMTMAAIQKLVSQPLVRLQPVSYAAFRRTSSIASLREFLRTELDGIRAAGTWKHERVITSPQAAFIRVRERPGEILNFCANNYLGLSVRYVSINFMPIM